MRRDRSTGVILAQCALSVALAGVPGARGAARAADSLTFPGVVRPARTALIKSMHDDRIAEVPAPIGALVEEGDLLLRMVDDQERVELERAEAIQARTRLQLQRTRELHGRKSVSDDVLEQVETEMRLADADARLARIRLEEHSIRAPFTGIVAERYVDPGASVERGDPLLRITAFSPLRAEALVPESVLPSLEAAVELEIAVTGADQALRIPYRRGAVVVDPASGTFLLQVEIANADRKLVPGASCRIGIAASR